MAALTTTGLNTPTKRLLKCVKKPRLEIYSVFKRHTLNNIDTNRFKIKGWERNIKTLNMGKLMGL